MAEAEEYEEAEVWGMMKAREGPNSISKTRKNSFSTSSSRAIPIPAGGPSSSSAPLTVPDWSKILKKKKKPKKNTWDDDACSNDDGGGRNLHRGNDDVYDDDDEMLPPHEFLARRLASTRIASFSMCEGGLGRTLKGRDLCNIRNAILAKTGFLE